jgi:hypothetical protein
MPTTGPKMPEVPPFLLPKSAIRSTATMRTKEKLRGRAPPAGVPRSKLTSARSPRASSRPTSWCKTTPGRCLYLTSKFLSTIFRFVLCWNDNIDLHFHVQIKVNEKKPRTPHKSRKTQLRVSKAHILLWHTTAPSLAQKQTHSRKIRKNCFSHPH